MDEIAASTDDGYIEPDVSQALAKFHGMQSARNICGNEPIVLGLPSKNIKLRRYLSYAAAILLIIGSISLLIPRLDKKTQQYAIIDQHFENPKGKRSKILLPDSSVVYLGPGQYTFFSFKICHKCSGDIVKGGSFF